MIDMPILIRPAALGAALLAAGPAATQDRPAASPLDRLEPGQWELRAPNGRAIAAICLGNPALLAQPQHGSRPCDSNVTASDARSVTMRYRCPGVGSGQTVIRVETPRLAQIDSQGLDHGTPFALRAQARRVGACPAGRR